MFITSLSNTERIGYSPVVLNRKKIHPLAIISNVQQACSSTLYQASNYIPCHRRAYKLYKTTLRQTGCTYVMQLTCYLQPHRLNKTAFVRTNLTENVSQKRSYKSVARHKHLSGKSLKNNRQSPSFHDDMVNILFLTGAQLIAFDTHDFYHAYPIGACKKGKSCADIRTTVLASVKMEKI